MSGGGGEGCKEDSVGNGEGHREEDGAVFLISLEVEGKIRVDDPRDVVYASRVIKRI